MSRNIHKIISSSNSPDSEENTNILERVKTKVPKRYKVFLHNDDYTTMEFVVMVLQSIFHMSVIDAEKTMLEIHKAGIGLCGVYTYEIAETKLNHVLRTAKEQGHPLKCTISPE